MWPGWCFTSSRASRSAAALDHGPHVLHGHQQADAGADLEVGRVALRPADHALIDQLVHAVDQPGQRRQVAPDVLVGGVVEAARRRRDRGRGERGEPCRDAELGALEVARHARAIAPQRVPDQAARDRLEHLVAPRLRLHDRGARGGIGREQRRRRHERLQRERDLARALHLRPVEPQRGHGLPGEAERPH
jgi:hypothetical protein